MGKVRAFQPRKIDPPHFVCMEYEELKDMAGQFIGGEQCDGCGNSSYQIRFRIIAPGTRQYFAKCAVDPTDDPEFRHTDPCGNEYSISIYDEDEVVF